MPRSLSVKIFLFSFITWTLAGCTKASPPVPDNSTPAGQEECKDYVFSGGEIFDTYITTGIQYARPFFNPNNSDEFVYVRSGTGTFTELVKYKISTGQEIILCNSLMIPSQPQWGRQGWIIFSVLNGTIWKIYEDGSQLTQITANGLDYHDPIINYAGDKFVHMGTSFPPYLGIFDLNGTIIDSVVFVHGAVSIANFVAGEYDFKNSYGRFYDSSEPVENFGYGKLNDNESVEKLTSFGMANGEAVAECRNNENIYYARYQDGLYQLNIASHQVDKVMDNCQSRYIVSLSMSPDGKSIIFERVRGHQTTPGGMEIDEQSEIFIYNTVTGKETKVLWEE